MFDDILSEGVSLAQRDWRLTAVVATLLPFALTYLITTLRAILAANWQKGDSRTPPIVPYAVPILGNLWAFANDNENAIRNALSKYARDVPVRFRIAHKKLTMISGSANVLALFRGSRDLTTTDTMIISIDNAFGGPMAARESYARDNTGPRKEPIPGSRPLATSDRVWYLQHRTLHANLVGPPLVDIARRFVQYLEDELDRAVPSTEWIDLPDFYALVQNTVFAASTTALYGPHFIRLNPSVCEDFWEFDRQIPTLFKLVPRLLAPKAYASRDRIHAAVEKWHKYAWEQFDWKNPELAVTEWEEFYGSKLLRDRARDFTGIDGFSEQVHAAFDAGLLWGANANIVPTVGWCIIDVLMRPSLLATVRAEIDTLSPGEVNMQALLASPILQSVYAEELRLRNSIFIQRTPVVDNFKIGPWRLAKGDMIVAASWQESRNRETWNERGRDGEIHDVEKFWAERFLTYADDPFSGPKKVDEAKVKAKAKAEKKAEKNMPPKFTPEAVTGQFIPYGGGEHICPGRFYAKQEAMAGMALFLSKFDIELEPGAKLEPDKKQFGFGVMGPKWKIPGRIRRRKV